MVRLHSEQPGLKKQKLVSAAHALTGLRHNALIAVFDNVVHCYENDLVWDPNSRYSKAGKSFGPTPRALSSPGATKRARTALKTMGSQRDAVLEFNRLAAEAGATPMGEKSHKFLADLAAHGPEGMKAFRRIRQPMVTQVNKTDRKSMADVIVTANKQRRPAGFAPQWSFAKDVICGDQFMVELGSGDLETRWEYLADGEMRTPISIVKFPQKLMVNMWCGWNFKSALCWCNKDGTLRGEKSFLKDFFKALEKNGGGCLDEYHGDDEACMACEACLDAREAVGHSFNEVIDTLIPGMVDRRGRSTGKKVWMDGATLQWTRESLEYLEEKCLAKRETRERMAKGYGEVLFSPTHRHMRTPGSAADGCFPDSGVIRHLKSKLRLRLAQEDGGRRQVLNKVEMFRILCEVWDAIPIDELRPYMLSTEKRWARIKSSRGSWVGWGRGGVVRHGMH